MSKDTNVKFEYKMVQVPPSVQVSSNQGTEAADYLQEIVNRTVKQGWEFYRVDSIGIVNEPGCLMSLLGQKRSVTEYYVVTFRRDA